MVRSTLNDRVRGWKSRQKVYEEEQFLTPAVGGALGVWARGVSGRGFLFGLDGFGAATRGLAEQNAEQMGNPTLAELRKTRLQMFLNRHRKVPPTLASYLDRYSALADGSGPVLDCLNMLKRALMEPP